MKFWSRRQFLASALGTCITAVVVFALKLHKRECTAPWSENVPYNVTEPKRLSAHGVLIKTDTGYYLGDTDDRGWVIAWRPVMGWRR